MLLMVADKEALKDVLVRNFNHFMDRRRPAMTKYFGKFLTQLCGQEWKQTRSIMSPTFTSGKMKAMIQLMNDCLDPMIKRIYKNSGKDTDMKSLFGCFTMDVIARCAFAVETNTHDDQQHPFVIHAKRFFTFSQWKLLIGLLMPKFIRRLLNINVIDTGAFEYMVKLGHHMIDERRKHGIKAENRSYNDFLQLMLEAGREEADKESVGDKKSLTDEEIIANIVLILLAGYETTASLLTYSSYLLALHPEIQTRLRQEIQTAKKENNGVLGYETLTSLPYLDAVITETLRMYPPVTKVDRQCSEDYTLVHEGKRIFIPKGAAVMIPIYAVHHMEEYYPEPSVFNPDRFLPENKDHLTPYTFLSFVAGPRNCIGMRFALLEAKLALSSLLMEFDFIRSPQTSVPLQFSSTAFLLNPKQVIVRMFKRQV